jgi:hypothetical protein
MVGQLSLESSFLMSGAHVLRDWEVLDAHYQHFDDSRADAQRIGERMIRSCLSDPIPHPPGDSASTEILSESDLFSCWNSENRFLSSCASIRCDEIPPEEITDELLATAIRPTCIEEE